MTDPTADAAKLLARAIMDEWAIEIPRRPTMMMPPFFLAEIAARTALDTRPQPAPPAGEPDFHRWLDQKIAEWSAAGGFHDFAVAAKVIRDRLGVAARPKVEDAEVAAAITYLGDEVPEEKAIADLLERLAVERDKAQEDYSALSVRHTDVERNLEAFKRDLKTAQTTIEAAETKLAELEAELKSAAPIIASAAYGRSVTMAATDWTRRYNAARPQQRASAEKDKP